MKKGMENFIEEHDFTTKQALNLVEFICPDEIKDGPINESFNELKKVLLTDLLKEQCKYYRNLVTKDWGDIPQDFINNILEKDVIDYKKIISELAIEIFKDMHFNEDPIEKLEIIATYYFYYTKSGVIIAGFGDDELYPSVISYNIGGLINNKLKYIEKSNQTKSITIDKPARIIPFAQHEMVDAFLEGVVPKYDKHSEGYINKLFDDLPPTILEIIEEIDDGSIDKKLIDNLREKIEKIGEETKILIKDYKTAMREKKQKYKEPILRSVATLPKDELASMAEALVHLTSLKRKFSFDQVENVGGAIDVAIISKGDGFIWFKRKHYFKAELNPHFFKKYNYQL
jgi:hypothetical protein